MLWLKPRVVISISVGLLVIATSCLSIAGQQAPSPYRGTVQRVASLAAGVRFKECRDCPEMVVVPRGEVAVKFADDFNAIYADDVNGAASHPAEATGRQVTIHIGKEFAVGIFHVTVEEYAAFAHATKTAVPKGCEILDPNSMWIENPKINWTHPLFRQTGRDPVVCINWFDAHAYVNWLNDKIKAKRKPGDLAPGPYRLLSVEEYAYLAQGGVPTPPGMEDRWREFSNFGADQCSPCGGAERGLDKWYYTSPVGSFLSNRFGVYDIAGNVYTWLDDCAHKDFVGAPTDGSAWTDSGDCRVRVGIGGAFNDNYVNSAGSPINLRELLKGISFGGWYEVHARNYANGLRVARSLE